MTILLGIVSLVCLSWQWVYHQRALTLLKGTLASSQGNVIPPNTPLSVVLCTKGPAPYLAKYLPKIMEQIYPEWECIVVYDEQYPIATKIKDEHPQIRWITLDSQGLYGGKKQALDQGIEAAKYDWIATIDDDCYPKTSKWLYKIGQKIEGKCKVEPDQTIDILVGLSPYISQSTALNRLIRYDWIIGTWQLLYGRSFGRTPFGIGRNMAFRKSCWSPEYLANYQLLGYGDDTTLVQYHQENKTVGFMPDELVYTMPQTNVSDWLRQKARHLRTGSLVSKKDLRKIWAYYFVQIIFYISLWFSISYLPHPLIPMGILGLYGLMRTYFHWRLLTRLNIRSRLAFCTAILDPVHTLYIMATPLFTLLVSKKWK